MSFGEQTRSRSPDRVMSESHLLTGITRVLIGTRTGVAGTSNCLVVRTKGPGARV